MFLRLLLAGVLFSLIGCAPKQIAPAYAVYGWEEFAAESDLIAQEGKFGILALEGKCFKPLSPDDFIPEPETLEENDQIGIALFHPGRPDLVQNIHLLSERIGGFRVEGGSLSVPGFEPIYVKGLTIREAQEKMSVAFKEEVKGVEVFLTVRKKSSRNVELLGLVRQPVVQIDAKTTLFEVLSKAAIVQEANLFASYLLRNGCPLKVDMNRLVRDGDLSDNVVMKPGDKIYIAHAMEKTALVMGEVRHPRPLPLLSGALPLREAIALAGGIPFTGDESHIYVIRGDICDPQIFVMGLDQVLQENRMRLLLIPGDVVYVTQKPITRWNIFLTELQPTLNLLVTGKLLAG